MPELIGQWGLFENGSSRTITVPRQTQIQIFKKFAVLQQDQFARQLGIYGDVSIGQNLEARFGSFSTPKHLWQARTNGCTWNPVTGMRLNVQSFPTCPIEFMGEQCPDALYGTCFEQMFSTGMGVRDLFGNPEVRQLMATIVQGITEGLGNSFFDLTQFALHPVIQQAQDEGFYAASSTEWANYTRQMLRSGSCAGLVTQLDALKAMGVPGYTMDVPVNDLTGNFNGTLIDLVKALKAQAGPEFSTMMQTGAIINGRLTYPVIMATPQIFDQYKDWIATMSPTNELAYRYVLEGSDGTTKLMRNVLVYDNMPIIRWDAHVGFDAITGAKSHRLAIVAPGVMGVMHDVDNLAQWNGMGLVVQQSQMLQDKGLVRMTTALRWGAGIADTDFIRMASNVLVP